MYDLSIGNVRLLLNSSATGFPGMARSVAGLAENGQLEYLTAVSIPADSVGIPSAVGSQLGCGFDRRRGRLPMGSDP